jgi:hypothetical protein
MRRIVFVLVAVVALAGVVAYMASASGQALAATASAPACSRTSVAKALSISRAVPACRTRRLSPCSAVSYFLILASGALKDENDLPLLPRRLPLGLFLTALHVARTRDVQHVFLPACAWRQGSSVWSNRHERSCANSCWKNSSPVKCWKYGS